jgi:2-polyprenyl-6-methoxyphenol hydroxylase-like FAD-dependent oxidoreductase
VSADPSGKVVTGDGAAFNADLVVGADGYRSAIRERLGLTASFQWLTDGATRILAPRVGVEREGLTVESWSGDCRVGVVPCSRDQLYLYMIGPEANERARALPVDKAFWKSRFPQLADIIERLPDSGRHDLLSLGRARSWSSGRVAIIGDAAHAQPPNMGQGAGLAMANASALAALLDQCDDVSTALQRWEAARRPVSDAIQLWSYRYGLLCQGVPARLLRSRVALVKTIGRVGYTSRKWGYLWRGGLAAGEASTFGS